MKKLFIAVIIFMIAGISAFADDIIKEAESLFEKQDFVKGLDLVKSAMSGSLSKAEQAQLYWLMARFQLYIGDDLEDEGADKDELIDMYKQGQEWANKAIELNPGADAYYWRLSNLGREGEIKGVLNSLAKAKPMKEDLLTVISYDRNYPDAFYVLSRLYYLLPGWPISFGDKSVAISFARRAIDLWKNPELKITYFKSLAEMLWDRKWNADKRKKQFDKMEKDYSKAKDEFERMSVYEHIIGTGYSPVYTNKTLGQMSDREEAGIIASWLEAEFKKITPKRLDLQNMKEFREMVADWD